MSSARKVWDTPVRILHLCFISGVAAAWFTRHAAGDWHEWIGYGVLVALCARLLWGFVGSRPARFTAFLRSPATTLSYARQLLRNSAPRYRGHNPLGAWMIIALLSLLLLISISGWLSTTDRYWGIAWVMNLHLYCTWMLLVLIPVHITGAVHASWKHRENLIAAMVHGQKRPASGSDIEA